MPASAELVELLAGRDALLIVGIEQSRVRRKWLTAATVVLALTARVQGVSGLL